MCSLKIQINATLGGRNELKVALRESAFNLGVDIDWEEEGGWFETAYFVKVEGEKDRVLAFQRWIECLVNKDD